MIIVLLIIIGVLYFPYKLSRIEGLYFNEFREYVDEEGKLSPNEFDSVRHKLDYQEDYEQD